jgi:hypothetical protein
MKTLLLSPKLSGEATQMKRAARAAGWDILQMPKWGERPPRPADAYYGESLYGLWCQQEGYVRLLGLPDNWLPSLPSSMRLRAVHLCRAKDARDAWGDHLPLFAKPVDEKTFPAGVFDDARLLPTYLDPNERILIASPVIFQSEYRVFLLDGKALTASRYATFGDLDVGLDDDIGQAMVVAEEAARGSEGLPPGVVIDVGLLPRGWAVVEANQAWGSGLYACDATLALQAIAASCLPISGPGGSI